MLMKKVLASFLAISLVASLMGMNYAVSATSAPAFNDVSKWSTDAGSVTQSSDGLTFAGAGTGKLIQSYYQDPIANINGFHITLNLDSLGSENNGNHDSNFGIVLTQQKTDNNIWNANNQGVFLLFQPFAANADINACWIAALYNTGGVGATHVNSPYLEINKNKGAIDIMFAKYGDMWYVFVDGDFKGVDLTPINSVLDAGNLYLGLVATENNTVNANNYAVRVTQVDGYGTGFSQNVEAGAFTASNKPNIAANQSTLAKADGNYLAGSLNGLGMNFKYGYNKTYKDLNGFSTTVNTTMDGAAGVNGSPNYNFGLTTIGDGTINADRLDAWDYFGSPVPGARGLEIKFIQNGTYYNTNIFVLGENGGFDLPGDYLTGDNILRDPSGNINITFLTTNNGGNSHWMILANGRMIINNNAAVNAELDALSLVGGCPVYSAGYDDMGSFSTVNAEMTIPSVGGSVLKESLFGTYNRSVTNVITKVSPDTLVSQMKAQISTTAGVPTFKNIGATALLDTDKVGTGSTIDMTVNGVASSYTVIIYGDVTGDGSIGVGDLIAMKQHLLNVQSLSGAKLIAGSISKNGRVSISDLLAVKKDVLKLATISQG